MAEAETARKRHRDESPEPEPDRSAETKRHCSLDNILSLLESEEDGEQSAEDLAVSSIITTLQQELAAGPPQAPAEDRKEEVEEEEVRRLWEASDDELGLPSREEEAETAFLGYDGFWEMEDEAANYYTLLQSELFLS